MAASPRLRPVTWTIQEQTIQEAAAYLGERLNKITNDWNSLKTSYVHFSSSITLAYPLCTAAQVHGYPFSEVTSVQDVQSCYEAMVCKNYTESAYVIDTFLQRVEELKQMYRELENCKPTLVASHHDSKNVKRARFVRDFCVELEVWRKMIEHDEVAETVHHEVLSLTGDKDVHKRTGRVFSVVPVMLDHANSLVEIMSKGWPPRVDGLLQRPRPGTGCILSTPRLERSLQAETLKPLTLDKSLKTMRPRDARQTTKTISHSNSMIQLPSLGNIAKRESISDDDDDGPLSSRSVRSTRSFSSSSAYETGPPSLSHVSITNSTVTISSDTESSQLSPMDKRPIVKEITEALQSKFDQELDKVTTRLEKKITDANDSLREDIQNDLQQRDKRIDKIKSDVDQLSVFVDEKFSDLDTELLRTDVLLRDYIRPLDDEQIHVIAQNVGPKVYRKMARELGMRQPQLEWIQQQYRDDEHEVVIAILHKWKQIVGMRKSTLETVIRALVKVDERETANQILRAFKEA